MEEDKPLGSKPPKKWTRTPIAYLVAGVTAAALSVAIYAGVQYAYQTYSARSNSNLLDNPASAEINPQEPGIQELKRTSESFRAVAKQVSPAVVKIKATKEAKKRPQRGQHPFRGRKGPGGGQGEGFRDPFFDFFERFGQPFPFQQEQPQESLGSGFIIDKKGYVVTNNHVIADANKIIVTLMKGENNKSETELKAKVIGTDPKTDLAVLKVESKEGLPFVNWANSDAVSVGDWAIAIGSPFALTHTVTVGIVSAKGRNSRVIGADYAELIQTDAAINPGNSGGPLCSLEGQVMGVNTAIYTRSGGYMGIGFAIPSNVAKDVINKLIADGKVIRGWLGVYIQPVDEDLKKELKIEDGVGVHAVMEDSPAQKAGIQAGDVVLAVNGKDVNDVQQLQRIIAGFKPGATVKLKVISYSTRKTRTVNVKIGELPADPQATPVSAPEDTEPDKLGLIVADSPGKGVAINWVESGSIANQVGLEKGDVILRINRKSINNVGDYKKVVESAKVRLSMEIKRKGRGMFFRFSLPN